MISLACGKISCINVAENVRVARLPSNQSIQIGQLPIILIFQLTFWLSNQILKKKFFIFVTSIIIFFGGGKRMNEWYTDFLNHVLWLRWYRWVQLCYPSQWCVVCVWLGSLPDERLIMEHRKQGTDHVRPCAQGFVKNLALDHISP